MEISAISEVGETPKKVCAVCQAPADKSCSACHQVAYCSAEHQKSHWKDHEKDCPPIRVVTSPELGPHFVATRDLPPWTLLLTELPVLINPAVFSGNRNYPAIKSCISCRSILSYLPRSCFKCSTPFFCSLSCSMNKVHSFECRILSKCSKEQSYKLCSKGNLGYLRAIGLKNSDPETWAKVLRMRGADQYKFRNLFENEKWLIREILPLVGEKGVGFEADLAKLKGIYQQRGILVHPSGKSPKKDHGESHLLYLEGSNFAKTCYPNCTTKIGKGPRLQLQVRNAVKIKKGQILYLETRPSYMGSITQQHMMHYQGATLCICPRCRDPTELGTMLSALKCAQPNCKDGYLLPIDPMDMAENAIWRCNRSGCEGKEWTWTEIEKITSKVERDIATLQDNVSIVDFTEIVKFWVYSKVLARSYYGRRFVTHLSN